jgi:hypothetical protein
MRENTLNRQTGMNFSAASCGVSQEGEEKEAQQAARNCPTLLGLKEISLSILVNKHA